MDNAKNLEEIVVTRLLRLNATLQGIVSGILFGLVIFAATNWLVIKGGPIGPEGEAIIGPHLSLLSQFFIGYRVTFFGSLIGFAYGFVSGFLVGYFIAWVHNCVADLREPRQQRHA
jgi:hypothetical protein